MEPGSNRAKAQQGHFSNMNRCSEETAIHSNSFAHRLFIMVETSWVYLWAFCLFDSVGS